MNTHSAPTPRDIFWKNVQVNDSVRFMFATLLFISILLFQMDPKQNKGRVLLVNVVTFFLIFFWATPIGAVTSMINLAALARLLRSGGAYVLLMCLFFLLFD
jgi:hypothetical protein